MNRDQVEEWFSHPVTALLFDVVKEQLKDLYEAPRYQEVTSIGGRVIPTTIDQCALQSAFLEGQIDSLKEFSKVSLKNKMLVGDE
ncbi:MAG: hypothetical protein V3T88_07825 [Nitrosomonadaceae bacterium]|jgi:antitoxin component HigA of HigAB toxin-antitoxin module